MLTWLVKSTVKFEIAADNPELLSVTLKEYASFPELFKNSRFTTVCTAEVPVAVAPPVVTVWVEVDNVDELATEAELEVATPKTLEDILPIEIFIV